MAELRAVYIIWYRDVLRFWRDRARIVISLAQPLLFLFVFGSGLSPTMSMIGGQGGQAGFDYVKFIYPGIITMTVLFTAIFSAMSIAWDREFGFLKEVLVSPVSRTAVAVGKTLGGSTIALFQGIIMLIFAPLVGVQLTPLLVVKLVPLMLLLAIALSSLGIIVSVRIKTMEGFQMVMNFLMMPMFFLSGAFFPLKGVPGWLAALAAINPVTYGVDPIRRVVFESLSLPPSTLAIMEKVGLGLQLFGHSVSITQDLAILGGFAALMTALAVWSFQAQA